MPKAGDTGGAEEAASKQWQWQWRRGSGDSKGNLRGETEHIGGTCSFFISTRGKGTTLCTLSRAWSQAWRVHLFGAVFDI